MKTFTYDETKWRIVPVEPTEEIVEIFTRGLQCGYGIERALADAIAAAPQPEPVETKGASFGWAVCNLNGEIDLRTVSPTENAAKVNWIFAAENHFVARGTTEEQIERLWLELSKPKSATVVSVVVAQSTNAIAAAAVRAENEACAHIAMVLLTKYWDENAERFYERDASGTEIAQAIRARIEGKTENKP